ncbi:MAG: LptA/OstA family protein [Opitutaceae bacterium]|nr:LptA/OstA family protein [Opitutaceae bacterium]
MMLLRALSFLTPALAFSAGLGAATPTTTPPGLPPQPTVIESGRAEMVSTDKESTFTFRDHVSVTGTNLKITCDELVVVARRSGDAAATLGKQENFKSLVATGAVRIVQGDREALCGRAEVFPGEDKVVLTQNPRVRMIDGSYEATGPRMILERGERRAVIEGSPEQRPTITLPPLKDLGYDKDPKKKAPAAGAKSDGDAPKTDAKK